MCSWWLSKAVIINNISAYHCNIKLLMLPRSYISILIWLLKVLPNLGGSSTSPTMLFNQPSSEGCGRAQTLLSIFLSINFHNKSKQSPLSIIIFNSNIASKPSQKKKGPSQKRKITDEDCSMKSEQMTIFLLLRQIVRHPA